MCVFSLCLKLNGMHNLTDYYLYQIKADEIENIWEENQKELEIYCIKLKNKDFIKATKSRTRSKCTCAIKPNESTVSYAICANTFYTVKELYHKEMARITKEQSRPIRYSSSDESNSTHEIADWTLIDITSSNKNNTKK